MTDLETLGTVPGCVILSIGAVEFFPETQTLGKEFYTVISTASCEDCYLRVDPSTQAWWADQSPEARLVLEAAEQSDILLPQALGAFNAYLCGISAPKDMRLYGNGADFDNPILRVAYDAADVDFMGSKKGFFGGRCYRTLKSLDELFGTRLAAHKISRHGGVHHNALDDAKAQAVHLMEFISAVHPERQMRDDHR
jgi:DNA polymerase III epsilon subunit-like protein